MIRVVVVVGLAVLLTAVLIFTMIAILDEPARPKLGPYPTGDGDAVVVE